MDSCSCHVDTNGRLKVNLFAVAGMITLFVVVVTMWWIAILCFVLKKPKVGPMPPIHWSMFPGLVQRSKGQSNL